MTEKLSLPPHDPDEQISVWVPPNLPSIPSSRIPQWVLEKRAQLRRLAEAEQDTQPSTGQDAGLIQEL